MQQKSPPNASVEGPSSGAMYPLFVSLSGRSCVVFGGGAVAERKVEGLLATGAGVTVVSPALTTKLTALSRGRRIRHARRGYRPGDLAGVELAFVATADRRVTTAVAREARRRRVWVNAADDPEHCDFFLPAVLRRGPLCVAVATGGTSPALAKAVKEAIDGFLPAGCATLAEAAASVRRRLRARGDRPDAATWNRALTGETRRLLAGRRPDRARARLLARLGAA